MDSKEPLLTTEQKRFWLKSDFNSLLSIVTFNRHLTLFGIIFRSQSETKLYSELRVGDYKIVKIFPPKFNAVQLPFMPFMNFLFQVMSDFLFFTILTSGCAVVEGNTFRRCRFH